LVVVPRSTIVVPVLRSVIVPESVLLIVAFEGTTTVAVVPSRWVRVMVVPSTVATVSATAPPGTEPASAVASTCTSAAEGTGPVARGPGLAGGRRAVLEPGAGSLLPEELRTLDAVHLVTAQQLGEDLSHVITYDAPMKAGAEALGLEVAAPT
jgi:hypothetical protein